MLRRSLGSEAAALVWAVGIPQGLAPGSFKWERQRTRKTQNVNRTPRFQVVILPNS